MTQSPELTCAVCPQRTTTRCSGCSTVAFCSREHQKLLWTTHKYVCKNGGEWTCAPLSAGEVAEITKRRDVPCLSYDGSCSPSLVKKLKRLHLFNANDWECLMRELSRPAPQDIEEPVRSATICMLRSTLTNFHPAAATLAPLWSQLDLTKLAAFPDSLEQTAWHHMTQSAGRFIWRAFSPVFRSEPDLDFFRRSFPFLQQMLVAHTLSFSMWKTRSPVTKRLAHQAFDRAAKILEEMDLDEAFKAELRAYLSRTESLVDRY
ncbi:hypothetical protein JCM6882_008288 [Rhodosporidiobolus microsporus]